MTVGELLESYFKDWVPEPEWERLLWNATCFPFGGVEDWRKRLGEIQQKLQSVMARNSNCNGVRQ